MTTTKKTVIAFLIILTAIIMSAVFLAEPIVSTSKIAYATRGHGENNQEIEVDDLGELGINDNISEHGDDNNIIINNIENRNSNANNAINELLDNDNNENPPAQQSRWQRADAVTRAAAIGYGLKAGSELNDMILDIIKNKGATDYPKYIIGMLRQGGAAAATVYFGTPAAGQVVDMGFDMILKWFHLGETSQTELEMMEARLNDQFDRLSHEIDEVKRDIADLSDQLDRRIENIMSKIDESFEAYYAKTQVTDFLYSTSGNFSYNLIRDYLYASGNNYSLYSDLATLLANRADDATVKKAYDDLYYALMHYDLGSGVKSNVDMFTEYYIADMTRRSIAHYYYEYLSSNQSYIDANASMLSAEFASQVYYDYLTMLNVVRLINSYQLTQIYVNNPDLTAEELLDARYYYGSGENDYVTARDIETVILPGLEEKAAAAYQQMLIDMEDILGLGSSYMIEEASGRLRYVTTNNVNNAFGNVIKGETIYLNQVISPYCNCFNLDANLFEYEFKQEETLLEENKKLGYYKVDTTGNFTGSVIYDGTVIYTINYRVGDNATYLGGKGTEDDPFIIATPEQFKLIYNEAKNDKCFLLVADIDLGGQSFRPLASDLNPYTGVFNGGGQVLKNFKVESASENATSIFGVIGSSGVVEYLELESVTISESGDNNAKKISTGIIAGTNNGTIKSCFIKSSSVKASRDSNENNENVNKAITMFVGAIAGENNGVIIYCKVESTSVTGESKRFYSANADGNNRNNVYCGGIVGANNYGAIENCYSASSNTIRSKGDSEMQEGLSFRYPYIDSYAGGIAGIVSSLKTIKNVYSDCSNLTADYHYKNRSVAGGSFGAHVEDHTGTYVPNREEKDVNTIKGANSDVYKIKSKQRVIKYNFDTEIDPEFNVSTDLVYVGTDTYFRLENMNLSLVIKDGEEEQTIDSCLAVIGVYGFNAVNHDKEHDFARELSIKIYDSLHNSVYTLNLGYFVKRNAIYKIALPENYNNRFDLNAEVPTDVAGALGVNVVTATYHDGTTENVAETATFAVDTSTLGLVNGTLTCLDFTLDVECSIVCNEPYDVHEVTILYTVLSEDKETCTVVGYRRNYCSQCGKMSTENISRVYDVNIVNALESTCAVNGYTGDLVLLADGDVLTEDLIVERGEYLPLLPHNYDYEHANIIDYRDAHSHYCINCHYQESHMFRTIENDNEVLCECVVCGYETSLEINDRELIERLPRVVVSNAYAVQSSREVKVFIDLHANTGITAANFSVNFDPALKLVSYKLGNILNGRDTIDAFKVYNDHINVTLVQSGTDERTDGTILTLTFRLPDDPIISNKYVVEVTNKDNKDKFTDKYGNKTDFVAYSGGIIVVSHLPGDINGDNTVNLVDAVILSNYVTLDAHEQAEFVAQMILLNPNFDMSYADVNLDGSTDISDAVQILRYTTGGYETTFVSNIFEVVLNYNDGTNRQNSFFVRYDGGNSTFGTIQPLPELQKIGYKFAGWFTDFEGKGTQVTNDTPVFYNTAQYKQTLYAHFVPNTITFDANGGEGEKPSQNYQSTVDLSNTYNNFYSYFTNESNIILDGNGVGESTSINKVHTFLGWALTPDGEVVYTEDDVINLNASGYNGVGNLVLYAVWSVESIGANEPEVDGYTFLGWTGANKKTVIWTGEAPYVVNGDITLYAKWRKNMFSFNYIGVGDQTHTETITRDINNYTQPLWINEFARQGYGFMGWALTEGGDVYFNNGAVMSEEQVLHVMEYIDNYGIVNLYSVWLGNQYTIEFNKNSDAVTGGIESITLRYGETVTLPAASAYTPEEHKEFVGWSIYRTGAVVYADQASVSNLTIVEGATFMLYAQWEYEKFQVTYCVSGALVYEDIVSYDSSYTFRKYFDGLDNYEAYSYSSVSYEPGSSVEHWTAADLLRDMKIEIVFAYRDNDNGIFVYTINNDDEAIITGYTGSPSGTLLIPHYIINDSGTYPVRYIGENAFGSSISRLMNFDKIVISSSVWYIEPRAFFKTKAGGVYLSSGLRRIYGYAFSEMMYVDDFVLPNVETTNVFYATHVTNLYFYGTIDQWQNGNYYVNYDKLYIYYTGGTMTYGYNYWKYENGVVKIVSVGF